MITIRELLQMKTISGIKLIAGKNGIDNKISIVNILENPDFFDWLSSNELLLSTGYIFKQANTDLNNIFKELSQNNCSGLCIKSKRYFDKLPSSMLELANHYNIPLLELPYGYSLSAIINIINEKTSSDYDSLNRQTIDLHNSLFKIALDDGGVEKISLELANTFHNPVIILDNNWNLLHFTEIDENPYPLSEYLLLAKDSPVLSEEFISSLPKNVNSIQKSITRIFHVKDLEVICKIRPVVAAKQLYGFIVVWQTLRELTEIDYIALEQAATILALERVKAREIDAVKLNKRRNFFDDLLAGIVLAEDSLLNSCLMHGIKPEKSYYCMIVSIENGFDSNSDSLIENYEEMTTMNKYIDTIQKTANQAQKRATCFNRSNRIIVLIEAEKMSICAATSESKSFARLVLEAIRRDHPNVKPHFGIGRQRQFITSIHKSFSEAIETLKLMYQLQMDNIISHFEDLSVFHLLQSNIKPIAMENFLKKYLSSIYDHDQSYGTNLINTLENYFLFNQNISAAAKAMFVHRNTFIYRIEKIKELLCSDLKNSEELLQIQISLKMDRLLKNRGSQ